MRLGELAKKVDLLRVEHATAARHADSTQTELGRAKEGHALALEAREVVQAAAEATQRLAHAKIASLVTRCVRAVFDEDYEFQIHFEQKRGKTEARLAFTKNGNEERPEMGSCGVVDVAALALRVACLLLTRPQRRRVLMLDEPFRHVTSARRPRVASLLEALSSELGVQFLLVTHDREFMLGGVVDLQG